MRITLSENEFQKIINTLDEYDEADLINMLLEKKVNYQKTITPLKRNATKKAIKVKEKLAKEKLNASVNLMRLMNAKININTVSKESGLAYNTVKKYKYLFCNEPIKL